jgi:hypothetical protein
VKDRDSWVLFDNESAVAETLSFLGERVSHAFRSPLAGVSGVIDDLAAGLEVEEEDYRLAKDAIARQKAFLDALRELAFTPSQTIETFAFGQEVDAAVSSAGLAFCAEVSAGGVLVVDSDRATEIRRGLTAFFSYLAEKKRCFGLSEESFLKVVLERSADGIMLRAIVRSMEMQKALSSIGEGDWLILAQRDSSFESILLFFSRTLFGLARGRCRCAPLPSGEVLFEVSLAC